MVRVTRYSVMLVSGSSVVKRCLTPPSQSLEASVGWCANASAPVSKVVRTPAPPSACARAFFLPCACAAVITACTDSADSVWRARPPHGAVFDEDLDLAHILGYPRGGHLSLLRPGQVGNGGYAPRLRSPRGSAIAEEGRSGLAHFWG